MAEMSTEETSLMKKINRKLEREGLKSRLCFLFVSGMNGGHVNEWSFESEIEEEAVQANTIVTDELHDSYGLSV